MPHTVGSVCIFRALLHFSRVTWFRKFQLEAKENPGRNFKGEFKNYYEFLCPGLNISHRYTCKPHLCSSVCFSISWASLCSSWVCASFRSQGQVDLSSEQVPALPERVSGVYRLYQLPLRVLFILSADICFAPAAHALPTSIRTGTMNETEDSGDKDLQLGPAM